MRNEPNYMTLKEKIRKQGMEIVRLQRENQDLKRDNKKLGEVAYILRMLNIARNSLARIVRMDSGEASGNMLADAIGIAQQAQRNITAEEHEMLKYYPVDVSSLPTIETY